MTDSNKKFFTKEDLGQEICVVVGTRPGIIMLAPVIHELQKRKIPHFVIHTGQHYSPSMDGELFEDLQLTTPAYHLKNVSEKTTHAGQTAVMMEGCEQAFMERKPRLVLVNGDANTNLAAALAARKLRIAVGHIEAGERSFDWRMPEEHNRRIMDHISELLFTTNQKGAEQLKKEHVLGEIHVTGNTIADASLNHAILSEEKSKILQNLNLSPEQYVLMTSHREENVDDPNKLENILQGAQLVSQQLSLPVIFSAHPRTLKRIQEFGLSDYLNEKNLHVVEALRYLDFMQLLKSSKMILTDSGGVQQEAYVHKRPCVTMRNNTEWTETLDNGANRLSGADDAKKILSCTLEAVAIKGIDWQDIFGDGGACQRIVDVAMNFVHE